MAYDPSLTKRLIHETDNHPLSTLAERERVTQLQRADDEIHRLQGHVDTLRAALADDQPTHGYMDRTCDYDRIQGEIASWRERREAALKATEP